MSDLQKIERIIRFLVLMSGNRSYTRSEIAERLQITERSVYRYLSAFKSAGLVVIHENGYRLASDNSNAKAIGGLFHFSDEEVIVLYELISGAKGGNVIREKLVRKLHSLYDLKALASLSGTSELEHVTRLREAIRTKKQVMLHAYRSSNSKTIQDRQVEPFEFLSGYEGIWCFDLTDQQNKQFLLSRIAEVKLQSRGWQYARQHKTPFTDAFGMSAAKPMAKVKLLLSLQAYNLLQEEFPLTKSNIKQQHERYLLEIPVADYHGIGRFVLGLPGEVDIMETKNFKEFLKKEMHKYNW